MPDLMPTTSRPFTSQLIGAVIAMILLMEALPARGETADTGQASRPCLQTALISQHTHDG
jgi:hypothetical protein